VNSLVDEGVLKKYISKKGDGTDELTNISYKCNFDSGYIDEVAKNIDFKLNEYLYTNGEEE
jgi:hypothetical protein